MTTKLTRRAFLSRFGLTAALFGAPHLAWAGIAYPEKPPMGTRSLALHNLHTDEKIHVTYWRDGFHDRIACGKINHLMRDHYSGDRHAIDLRLIDLLHDLQQNLRNDRPIEIISGYRSPATNRELAMARDGIAKNSFHMRGMAADIRFDGTHLHNVNEVALKMDRGGVGYYPDSQFVHIDVGPRDRRWG